MVRTPDWPTPLGHKPIDLGLERIRQLLERLGNPHHHLPPVVHIAGTNGKGSTLAFMRAMLEAAGYRVHVYTSPHLVQFNERVVLAGEIISDAFLEEVLAECKEKSTGISITFFEGTTAAAFLAFSRVPADILLLETGLGGKLDATNVLDTPALTVITPISSDHTEFLGTSIASIAGEKAGIMKAGVTCISAQQLPEALGVLQQQAEKLHAPLYYSPENWNVQPSGEGFDFLSEKKSYHHLPHPALFGKHQYSNAGTAIAALSCLPDFNVTEEAIRQGLTTVRHAARMQKLSTGTLPALLPAQWELWLDGGHNPAAGEILADVAKNWNDTPLYLITGMLQDKDSLQFFTPLAGLITQVITIPIPEEPKSQTAETLCHTAKSLGIDAIAMANAAEAVKYLTSQSKTPARILICGSLYLAGSILATNS